MILLFALAAACSGGSNAAPTTLPATTSAAPPTTTRARVTTTTAPPTTLPASTTSQPAPSSTTSLAPTTTSSPPTTTTTSAPPAALPVWPPYVPLPGVSGVAALTNLAAGAELENVPALAVKVDNHPAARPQWSLSSADVIVEENVESLTRFIAIFHSRLPAMIGPIRSARTSDLSILAAFNRPVLAWSGGNANVTSAVRAAARAGILVTVSAMTNGRCYHRDSSRKSPHNLVLDPGCVLDAAPSAGAARPAWSFDDAYVPPGETTGSFDVNMDGVRVAWVWDAGSGRYLRSQDGHPHVAADGVQISATNVVVMTVDYLPSPADERSPEAQTVGQGNVVVNRNGVAVTGTWSRVTATDPFLFLDAVGAPIPLASGTTFIELARG